VLVKIQTLPEKSKSSTKESLHQAISEAVNTITKENSKGWFEHCGYIVE